MKKQISIGADEKEVDEEKQAFRPKTKIRYPIGIPFLICSKLFERYSYLAIQTVLIIYLSGELSYSITESTVLFHFMVGLQFFTAIVGAVASDCFLGQYWSIVYMSTIFMIGSCIVFVGSLPSLALAREWTLLGLFLLSFGEGCLKPVLLAFGGAQFQLPEQAKQSVSFFSWLYLTLKVGNLISTTISPILRQDVKCYGMDYCFPMTFGVATVTGVIAIGVFYAGTKWYRMPPPRDNTLVQLCKCIFYACSKIGTNTGNSPEHWIDRAESKYGRKLVNEAKVVMSILLLYIPIPIYWSLVEQIGSTFTVQATQLDGRLPFYTIKPDQFQVTHYILVIIFVPIFDTYIYPVLSRIGLKRPLQKMSIGGCLVAFSFMLAGVLQLRLHQDVLLSSNKSACQLRLYNPMPCDYYIQTTTNVSTKPEIIKSMETFQKNLNCAEKTETIYLKSALSNCFDLDGSISIFHGKTVNYMIQKDELTNMPDEPKWTYSLNHIILIRSANQNQSITILDTINNQKVFDGLSRNPISLPASEYTFLLNGAELFQKNILPSGVSTLMLAYNPTTQSESLNYTWIVMKPPNTVHMLWQLPQYISLALGDTLFAVTGLSFTYTEAPASMKTVMQAFWLILLAFGHGIDMVVVGAKMFHSQALQMFAFSCLMFVNMAVFMWLAKRYRPNKPNDDQDSLERKKMIVKQ